jgi:hypothetical protein
MSPVDRSPKYTRLTWPKASDYDKLEADMYRYVPQLEHAFIARAMILVAKEIRGLRLDLREK